MKEFELKYGCNPNQKPAKIFMHDGSELPIKILNGKPGYINFLDAFNSYQLVKELKAALGMPAATSFKHVSPTSAAIGLPLPEKLKKACFVDDVEGLDVTALFESIGALARSAGDGAEAIRKLSEIEAGIDRDFIMLREENNELRERVAAMEAEISDKNSEILA